MSRVGKEKIDISQVKHKIENGVFSVEGPMGSNIVNIPSFLNISINNEKKNMSLSVTDDNNILKKLDRKMNPQAMHGTVVRLLKNAVEGVTKGFSKIYLLKGIGYRCTIEDNKKLSIQIGYSHLIVLDIPEGLKITSLKADQIKLTSPNKDLLGRFGEKLTKLRKWNPYKEKGIISSDATPRVKKVKKT